MNITYLYFYLTGILTSLFAVLYFYTLSKLKTKNKKYSNLLAENKSLKTFKDRRLSKQRLAVFKWPGWHAIKNPQHTWSVTFNLKEIARSETDPDMYQFEVISVISADKQDTWGLEEYRDYFNREGLGGGWINLRDAGTNGKSFHWVTTDTKENLRDDKLEELGI
jgi:hypothetical protein